MYLNYNCHIFYQITKPKWIVVSFKIKEGTFLNMVKTQVLLGVLFWSKTTFNFETINVQK